ncbi:MAG: hypothetical protein HXX14_19080 [Bacteroidetes bacterium]|nr:hypothetical protein [Bacteroidota bacterium]
MWILLIVFIIALIVFLKFQLDIQKVKEKNRLSGGLKNLFPQWVDFCVENKMDLVQENGTDLVYKQRINNPSGEFIEFYIGIQSEFTNIAYGWVVHSNGSKIKSSNYQFGKIPNEQDIEKIFDVIINDLKAQNAFNFCLYGHNWHNQSDNLTRTCKNCFKVQGLMHSTGVWIDL